LTKRCFLSISQLTEHLNLTDNWLTGTVPSTLGFLPKLSLLDVGKNLLTGTIPESICNMTVRFNMTDMEPLEAFRADCNATKCYCCTECADGLDASLFFENFK